MMRALILILGLLTGFAAAMVLAGQMSHLRWALGDRLPGWTRSLDADASLLEGQGRLPDADLRWRFAGVDTRGPNWRVTLTGTDWQAQGILRLGGADLRAEALAGLVPGALLETGGSGAFMLDGGALQVVLGDGQILEGSAQGQARALTLDGAVLDGAVSLRVAYGDWGVQP